MDYFINSTADGGLRIHTVNSPAEAACLRYMAKAVPGVREVKSEHDGEGSVAIYVPRPAFKAARTTMNSGAMEGGRTVASVRLTELMHVAQLVSGDRYQVYHVDIETGEWQGE